MIRGGCRPEVKKWRFVIRGFRTVRDDSALSDSPHNLHDLKRGIRACTIPVATSDYLLLFPLTGHEPSLRLRRCTQRHNFLFAPACEPFYSWFVGIVPCIGVLSGVQPSYHVKLLTSQWLLALEIFIKSGRPVMAQSLSQPIGIERTMR